MPFEHNDGHWGRSVNSTTDLDEIPACALVVVMREVSQRVLELRVKFGDRARILIHKMVFKNAFRQISVDSDVAAAFGYVLVGYHFVDLPLQVPGGEAVRGGGALYRRRCSMRNVTPREHPRRYCWRGTER